jgi:enamine deaminase RidA (YjgF/YER057c/UK114 family)
MNSDILNKPKNYFLYLNKKMMKKLLLLPLLFFVFTCTAQSVDAEKKLKELGIELITPTKPIANYVKAVRTGNLIFLAGHGPTKADGTLIIGKVGKELSTEQGTEAARQTAISLLSTLKAELGDLNKVKRIVKVLGMVNCTENFTDQPKVINGFSDLMVQVFGEKGKHARSAVGMYALPSNIAVEIEMIVEVE